MSVPSRLIHFLSPSSSANILGSCNGNSRTIAVVVVVGVKIKMIKKMWSVHTMLGES